MRHIRNFFHNINDIVLAVIIVAVAVGIIYWRMQIILDYPKQLINDQTAVEQQQEGGAAEQAAEAAEEQAENKTEEAAPQSAEGEQAAAENEQPDAAAEPPESEVADDEEESDTSGDADLDAEDDSGAVG